MYYLQSRYYNPEWDRFLNADGITGNNGELLSHNLFTYCLNNPINREDPSGYLSRWAKVAIGVGVIAALGVLTVATAGTGTALACVAMGAFEGAMSGAVVGALSGGAVGAATGFVTGGWDGAKEGFLDGAASGFMEGAITGAITGGANSSHCFVAGTLVATENGDRPIEEIIPGDSVYAYNEETGEVGLKPVIQTFVSDAYELVHVKVNGETIDTTTEHPFYLPDKGWTAAIQLRAGDKLLLKSGKICIVEMVEHEILEEPVKVYNFEVADWHTYYVSDRGVLVHNTCHGHHTYPKYLGGEPKQPLVKLSASEHSQLHSELRKFKNGMFNAYRGRLGADIVDELGRDAVIDGLRQFYSQPKWSHLLDAFEDAVRYGM